MGKKGKTIFTPHALAEYCYDRGFRPAPKKLKVPKPKQEGISPDPNQARPKRKMRSKSRTLGDFLMAARETKPETAKESEAKESSQIENQTQAESPLSIDLLPLPIDLLPIVPDIIPNREERRSSSYSA